MIACVDVDYRAGDKAVAAGLYFSNWDDAIAAGEVIAPVENVMAYESGRFYERELPCLLAVLGRFPNPPRMLVVDAYVYLDGQGRKGLGAYLFDSLGCSIPVIGVAKTLFVSATCAIPILRGQSKVPLWITSAGIDCAEAAGLVQKMHGPYRIPHLLSAVDRLARTSLL